MISKGELRTPQPALWLTWCVGTVLSFVAWTELLGLACSLPRASPFTSSQGGHLGPRLVLCL